MEIQLKEKLKKIKLLAMDVDGTLSDGKVYYSKNGEELKAFSIRDGMGIELLHTFGIMTAIITHETSQIVTSRAMRLKIEHVILGSKNKLKDLFSLCEQLNLSIEEVAFIGDDINDIPALKAVGFSACPRNSIKYVKDFVDYICEQDGGNGAVRELAELILDAQERDIFSIFKNN
ncbi:MAG: HAD-IIIA family hydrolase [Ignavibacteria bacterium]|nr:HAD-IIIA family hydrolase [Ignavibacteria bacterium]